MRLNHALMAAALAAAAPASAEVLPFGPSSSAYDGSHAPHRRALLAEPIEDGGDLAARRLLARGHAGAGRPASHVSPGERQLAASLGLDPAAFTLAELAQVKSLRERDED